MNSINIIESTDPKDRPTEAVAQLRDIAEWLQEEGHYDLADKVDSTANSIVRRYGV